MRKCIFIFISLFCLSLTSQALDYYWVFFTDKNDVNFNPYEYFDSKAIERRIKQNIPISDISDFPLNSFYSESVSNLCNDIIGESRWLNALAVETNHKNIKEIESFSFVKAIIPIKSDGVLCSNNTDYNIDEAIESLSTNNSSDILTDQLKRMGGEAFIENNIDGKGIRIAILDGGFPNVDTHVAFKHLRENNQIISTYNFPKKREDVYGWNSHGTLVLSCVAGKNEEGKKLGFATGSEFLLARTEIGLEPAKEEVWWIMGVEWADKNGATVINSSLGYGADRHTTMSMDGKTALVTKAANIAAGKGILICNSMGNEGTKASWKTLIAPADADSVISVGGISPYRGTKDRRINFSSFGPTADGRLKPNVVAFGNAKVAQTEGFGNASGTSFSSPLVAGFVACAWQTNPKLKAMELKELIEKSGDNYPYFDYSIGYGVPQADYFFNPNKVIKPSLEITENDSCFVFSPERCSDKEKTNLYYHIRNKDGFIEFYQHFEISQTYDGDISIRKEALLDDKTLSIHYKGYTKELTIKDIKQNIPSKTAGEFAYSNSTFNNYETIWTENNTASKFGVNSKYYIQPYYIRANTIPDFIENYNISYAKSSSNYFGIRYINNITKWYRMGLNIDYGISKYYLNEIFPNVNEESYESYNQHIAQKAFNVEYFKRFRLVPGSMVGTGIFIDLGIYGSWIFNTSYKLKYETKSSSTAKMEFNYNEEFFSWGLRTRIGYGMFSLFGQYNIFDIEANSHKVPKLQAGIEIAIPTSL